MTRVVPTVRQIENKQTWESFIKSQAEYTFLHSWNWGEFSKLMGDKVWRLGIYEGEELAGVALIVGVDAKRGKFLFVPHGPIIRMEKEKLKIKSYSEKLKVLLDYLENIARNEGYNFIRISSLVERIEENEELFGELGFRRSPIHMHAESTLLLDITKPEEELLKNMRKTTRYLIKRMEKEGVEVETENPPKGDYFLKLQEKVAERKHFIVFSEKQIKNEIKIFASDGELAIFNAKYGSPSDVPASRNGKIVASAIIIYYGYRAFYYQSASYTPNKNISAPYFLLWRAIQEAKKRGCKIFDFYGASPIDKPNHPWAGPTLFKQGFGSYRVDYLPAQDLVLNWKYWVTYLIETARKIKRGF